MSFRNRCLILGGNGPMALSVPLEGGRNVEAFIRDIKIDNRQKWQLVHWRSIVSAYNRSPWFEFYRSELEMKFTKSHRFLWDWNLELMDWVFDKLGYRPQLSFSESYRKPEHIVDKIDMRGRITPRSLDGFKEFGPRYRQVFEDRFGFIPNLSILDLLFSEGRNALQRLKEQPFKGDSSEIFALR